MAQEARGSAKLWDRVFEADPPTGGDLSKAVSGAQSDYTVKRWWKYGQPAIDLIRATLDVKAERAGSIMQEILNAAPGNRANVILEAFPYGLPKVDGVEIKVTFEKDLGGR
jgi:hypothetical protein